MQRGHCEDYTVIHLPSRASKPYQRCLCQGKQQTTVSSKTNRQGRWASESRVPMHRSRLLRGSLSLNIARQNNDVRAGVLSIPLRTTPDRIVGFRDAIHMVPLCQTE